MHGTDDSVVPYNTDGAAAWAGYNGCADAASPTVTSHTGYNQHLYHSGCDSGVEVAMLELPSIGARVRTPT